jgi:hypothetical protein
MGKINALSNHRKGDIIEHPAPAKNRIHLLTRVKNAAVNWQDVDSTSRRLLSISARPPVFLRVSFAVRLKKRL